jgi:hypothetical protein
MGGNGRLRMKNRKQSVLSALKPALIFLLAGCLLCTLHCRPQTPIALPEPPPGAPDNRLSPAHAYAGEVLAYMMQVVLGAAGAPGLRNRWRTRAVDESLDFHEISDIMTNPGKNKSRLLVQDTNILGLSAVLYHYDGVLNQFKGRYASSFYPSAELIALRLLMARKIDRGERVDLSAVLDRSRLFVDSEADPAPADLSAMNFSAAEFGLLKAVIQSEPRFLAYMRHPFMVKAFQRIGLVKPGPGIETIVARANYRAWACRARPGVVNLLLVPSITGDFDVAMTASHRYLDTVEKLKEEIFRAVDRIIDGEAGGAAAGLKRRARAMLAFHHPSDRPFVVHPANADRTIGDLCPEADFTLVLLGKDVYRAVHIDIGKDVYPAANRIYLDLSDIRYGQVGEEIEQVGRFVYLAMAGFF